MAKKKNQLELFYREYFIIKIKYFCERNHGRDANSNSGHAVTDLMVILKQA